MEITGTIIQKGETQIYGNNGFRKREIVVQTDEQYPQPILIEFIQDKCDILNNYALGNNVTVGINLRGREWTNSEGQTRYFNSIQGWKISKNEQEIAQQSAEEINNMSVNNPQFEPAPALNEEDNDDLPF